MPDRSSLINTAALSFSYFKKEESILCDRDKMVNQVGLRFLPTDEEIVDHYHRLKNLGGSNTGHVDQVISTVNICNFDPWELPSESRMESEDQVWYFFRRKQNRYNTGERQIRKTKSGFWKKTGVSLGEKSVLVFHSRGSRTNWIMHEYEATPNTNMTYTICKVHIKDEARDASSPGTEIVAHSDTLPTHMNNELITGSEGLQRSGFLDKQQEPELEETFQEAFDSFSSFDWKSLLNDDEQS